MANGIGITDMERAAKELESLSPGMLELLERETTALLYALWKARGKQKRIVDATSNGAASLTNDPHND